MSFVHENFESNASQHVTLKVYAREEVGKILDGPDVWYVQFHDPDKLPLGSFSVLMTGLDDDMTKFFGEKALDVTRAIGSSYHDEVRDWLISAYSRAENEIESWQLVRKPE
ncbi:hypothetical protein FGK63_14895 [Ruegeria sediminis]|uniref:DUF5076 domain-containing protein n=1 Tax=Ruegeria sediminis TaxID=2583820 RepID=A0ABY2WUZ5_9RHOB|nr:hypothetical protein [Ruegeria sediminis]TMV06430.1 hypothetical protein FGK63_14895 [Ruegeria sediminis]